MDKVKNDLTGDQKRGKGLPTPDEMARWDHEEWASYFESLDSSWAKKQGCNTRDIKGLSDAEVMAYLWNYSDYESHPVMALAINLLLRMLPKGQRNVVYLLYRDERSIADIARLEKCAHVTVLRKKRSALKKIKDLIMDGALDRFVSLYKDEKEGLQNATFNTPSPI